MNLTGVGTRLDDRSQLVWGVRCLGPSRTGFFFDLVNAAMVCAGLLFSGPASGAAPIVLDVGHSLQHPGAMSAAGQTEFSFNKALAESVAVILRQQFSVLVVAADGSMESLAGRARAADAAGARLFVSIHHDSVQPQFAASLKNGSVAGGATRFSGFSLFVSHDNLEPKASLRCASAIGAALVARGFHASRYHAERIPGEGYAYADRTHGVFFHDQLAVLHDGHQPAVLIEAGVIANPIEEQRLLRPDQHALLAHAIASGIINCQSAK